MKTIHLASFAAVTLISSVALGASEQKEAMTAHYRLVLDIGPMEMMYTAKQVKAQNLTSGEEMVVGHMADMGTPAANPAKGAPAQTGMPGMPPATTPTSNPDARHLEVHVYSLADGSLITAASMAIRVIDNNKKAQNVHVAKMFGIAEGAAKDTHFGNNVMLPAGSYVVEVTVRGEKASIPITIGAGA